MLLILATGRDWRTKVKSEGETKEEWTRKLNEGGDAGERKKERETV